jgi:agmatinase
MELKIDPFSALRVVDYGDIPAIVADAAEADSLIQSHVQQILEAGALPVVLGGDHSIAYSTLTAASNHYGVDVLGVVQFDTHADTGSDGGKLHHGTPMRLVIDERSVRGDRFLQFGLRGYWPGPSEFDWMRSVGMRWTTMFEIQDRGIQLAVDQLVADARALGGRVYVSIDVDVLDPAFAPGTGTPEPGGLTTRELLYAVRRLCAEVPIAGLEVVEVSPPYDSSGITALAAHRCILEALSGLASRLPAGAPQLSSVD